MDGTDTREKYDFAFSLGAACASSLALRFVDMQGPSLPFDWLAGGDIVGRAKLIGNGFQHWLDVEAMELTDVMYATFNASIYRNRITGITFPHDFPAACYLEDELPAVAEKYGRRIARLYAEIGKAKRVLAVYNEIPYRTAAKDSELEEALTIIRGKFPETEIDILYFAQDPDRQDRPPRKLGDHITVVMLDYASVEGGYIAMAAQYHRMMRFLRDHYEVTAPSARGSAERYHAADAEKERRRWGTGWERWFQKRVYRLYRHLERYLAAHGRIPPMEHPLKLYPDRGERRRSFDTPDVSTIPGEAAKLHTGYELL